MRKYFITLALLIVVAAAHGQNIYWNVYGGTCTDVFNSITVLPTVTASQWVRGANTCTSNTTGFSATGFNQPNLPTAVLANHYVEATLTETAGSFFELDTFVWVAYRSGTGPTSANVQYSVNGAPFTSFGSVLAVVSGTTYAFPLAVPVNVPALGNVRIRLYACGASSAVGTMRVVQGSYARISNCVAPSLNMIITDVLCNPDSTGSIDLVATAGTSPFTYSWTGPGGFTSSAQDINLVPSGIYSVTVTATGGCTTSTSVLINQPSALILTNTNTNVDCNGGNNGAIDLTVSGGVGPYDYLWSNTATTEDIGSLSAGTYSVVVTDYNGCTSTSSHILTAPSDIIISGVATNPSCSAVSNGSINISISGGSPGFSYLWNNTATTQDITGISNGTYVVLVTDTNGCSASYSATLTSSNSLDLSATWTNASCNGGDDASINLTVNSGLPLYSYVWSNGAASQDLSGITAGNYSVSVTDGIGCTGSLSQIIGEAGLINSYIEVETCGFYTSPSGLSTWTVSGLYADTLTAINGCDSLLAIDLIVNHPNVGVNAFGHMFTAQLIGATYQWIDCNLGNAPIVGANSQTYIAPVDGDFAVIVTYNGCTDTSDCYATTNASIADNELAANILLFPNPSNGIFNISIDGLIAEDVYIHMTDLTGKMVNQRSLGSAEGNMIVSFDESALTSGMYFIQIVADGKSKVLRWIKSN